MDKLIISGEGFPLVQEGLEFIEDAYVKPMEALSRALGNNVIVSGALPLPTEVGQNTTVISSGYVVIGNELMPFTGGTPSQYVIVVEETTEAGYDIQGTGNFDTQLPVWKKRYAKFGASGSGISQVLYSSLIRLRSNQQLQRDKLSFLKSGRLKVMYENPTDHTLGSRFVTDDFIAVERLNHNVFNDNLKYKITFNTPIDTEYWVLPQVNGGIYSIIGTDEVCISDLESDSFILSISPQPSTTGVHTTIDLKIIGK